MNIIELNKIKKEALQNKIPIIMDDALEYIITLLKQKKPNNILEIGTAIGYSASCFSEYLSENGKIDTIEINTDLVNIAMENIQKLNLQSKINIINADACEVLPTLKEKYDIIFIDASKSKYPFFLEESIRLIKDEGIIIADNILYKGYVLGDYNKHKQRTAVNRLREYIKISLSNDKLITQILEIGDGLAVSYKKQEKI